MNIRPIALTNFNQQYKTKNDQTSFGLTLKDDKTLNMLSELFFLQGVQSMIPKLTKSKDVPSGGTIFKDRTAVGYLLTWNSEKSSLNMIKNAGDDEIHNPPSVWTTTREEMDEVRGRLFDEIALKLTELSKGS